MSRYAALFFIISLSMINVAMSQSVGTLRATTLRCESMNNPIGIDARTPRLSWIVESDRRAQLQQSYRILVASTPELLEANHGDLWDSGRVDSDETIFIPYAGTPLRSRQRCHWKVMTWDGSGNPSEWSEAGSWEMGLLKQHDWTASWIDASPTPLPVEVISAVYRPYNKEQGVDVLNRVREAIAAGSAVIASNNAMGGDPAYGVPKVLEIEYECREQRQTRIVQENASFSLPTNGLPYLRSTFDVDKSIVHARLYITALGVYDAYLNGKRISNQRMAPGWTDYRQRVQYQMFDVSDLLVSGPNVIGAIVAPGWYAGRAGLFHAHAFYGDAPALLAQLEIEYDDGSTKIVVSDEGWSRHDGPTIRADIMDGESYDARLELPRWSQPRSTTGSDAGWSPVQVRDEQRKLVSQPDQPVRELMELPAMSVTESSPGIWIFDLGQNMVGVTRLRIDEPAGTRITIRHAEMLNSDGTLYTENLRGAPAIDTYITSGLGQESWSPRFTFHGFRYVEVSGLSNTPELGTVTGIVVGTDLPQIGTFECSDERINQLQSNIVWGMRGNMLSIPTDCPQRDERMGWTADAQVFMPTAAYNADIGPFMTKWMRDIRDAQRPDGAHSDVAPVMKGLSYGTPVWGDAGTIVPWVTYRYTGDTHILQENIESMSRWVDWCKQHSTELIRDRDRGNDYGDWLSINADTPKDLIGTAYFARSARIVAQAYEVLGDSAQAARYHALFAQIKAAFIERYVRDDGSIVGNTQTCYLVALRFDLLPESMRERAAVHLVDDLHAKNWHLSTGFVGVSHLLPVLHQAGRADVAYRLLLQDEFPSWLFSVRHGATTIWERWNGWTPEDGMNDPGMNSFNHFALGSCGEWFFSGIAGIQLDPSEPGFSRFLIHPQIHGPLAYARATYESPHGTISSAWYREDRHLTFEVKIPTNTIAVVTVPTNAIASVTESGNPIDKAEGVRVLRETATGLELQVGGGQYRFGSTIE